MKFLKILILVLFGAMVFSCEEEGPKPNKVDVCVYGGTSAGVMAAYSAAKMGKTVMLIEPGNHLGGLTAGGLGATDIGNKYAITGLARDFYRKIGQNYGEFEQWTFEPKVAERIFNDFITKGGIQVKYEHQVIGVEKLGTEIRSITLENSDTLSSGAPVTVRAAQYIDASYEGDLMARAGVSYKVGREANSKYKETYNGVSISKYHQFPDGVDPYKIKGDSSSGYLWGISVDSMAKAGTGDTMVQAYNFRVTLTNDPLNQLPIYEPEGFDPDRYELLIRSMEVKPWKSLNDGFIWSLMPNGKTDINNRGPFSTDMIGMNHDYPEAEYKDRLKIIKEHEIYTKGLFYFIGNDPRIPDTVRNELKKWGYPKDEFLDNGHFSHQLYVRESRRMIGEYVMTQANCQGKVKVRDNIGMAAYTMDSHNTQRIVIYQDGKAMVKNEGDVEIGGFPPYDIAYRSITPKREECTNLLVPVCLSASHIAYGSIRMEPVFMVLGQSAGVAAAIAVDDGAFVQSLDLARLKEILKTNPLLDGNTAEVLVDNSDTSGIEFNGAWTLQKGHGNSRSNGADHLIGSFTAGDTSKLVIRPTLVDSGRYEVRYYCPGLYELNEETEKYSVYKAVADTVLCRIHHKGGATEKKFAYKDNIGKWADLGRYEFAPDSAYIEILTSDFTGQIGADAVLWVPK